MLELLFALADLLQEADTARESGNSQAPAARLAAALPADLLVIFRTFAEVAHDLEKEARTFDAALSPIDPGRPPRLVTRFRSAMREVRVSSIAIGVLFRAFFDAVEADTQARDEATAALSAGSAERDKDGRVVLRVVPDNA
jgi:hypothetical protein